MSVLDVEGRPMAGGWIPGALGGSGAGTVMAWNSLRNSVRRARGPLGVVVDGTTASDALAPWLGDLDLVVIVFDAAQDEDALLLASVLRECHGYRGEICASGPITPREHRMLKACGFSMLAPDEGCAARLWEAAGMGRLADAAAA